MVLCTMKNAYAPTTHLAAALLGAAVATTLLTNKPLGLSLTPRMELDLRETQVRAPAFQKMTSMHSGSRLSALGCRIRIWSCEFELELGHARARARAACAAREPLIYRGHHSKCHLMPLMSPLLHNRGALLNRLGGPRVRAMSAGR